MTVQEAIDLLDNLKGMIEDNHNSDYDSAFKMAIEALEKQVPMKPIDKSSNPKDWHIMYCPACEEEHLPDLHEVSHALLQCHQNAYQTASAVCE